MLLNTLILEILILLQPGVSLDGAGPQAVLLTVMVAALCMLCSFCGMLFFAFTHRQPAIEYPLTPAHRPYNFSLSVVLPAYNEEPNIAKVLTDCLIYLPRVLATCHICQLIEASVNTFPRHSHLADSPESG
jgi:hypothetical protein